MAGYRKLGRTSSQRKALIRGQVTSLLNNGKIVTTEARAKEISKVAEGLIALAVKEKDNFDEVEVTSKVARKDKDGKRVKEVVDGKKVTVFDEVKKTIKTDQPSRLHARRQMNKVLYTVTDNTGKKKDTKKVDLTNKLFDEIAPKYADRKGGYTRIVKIAQRKGDAAMEVGPATARMLHLLPEISRYYGRSRTSTTRCIRTTEQMGSYLMAKFAWSDYERAMLVSLDSRKRVRAAVWLREGTTDRVSLDIKDVVSAAIKGGTDTVVLSHNHPNGAALPSMEDLEATGNIARALGLVNIHLLDHFILTDTEYFSMRDANRLPIYDFKTGTLFWP